MGKITDEVSSAWLCQWIFYHLNIFLETQQQLEGLEQLFCVLQSGQQGAGYVREQGDAGQLAKWWVSSGSFD